MPCGRPTVNSSRKKPFQTETVPRKLTLGHFRIIPRNFRPCMSCFYQPFIADFLMFFHRIPASADGLFPQPQEQGLFPGPARQELPGLSYDALPDRGVRRPPEYLKPGFPAFSLAMSFRSPGPDIYDFPAVFSFRNQPFRVLVQYSVILSLLSGIPPEQWRSNEDNLRFCRYRQAFLRRIFPSWYA